MTSRAAALAALPLAVLTVVAVPSCWRGADSEQPGADAGAGAESVAAGETTEVYLYFPGAGGRLYRERRQLALPATVEERVTVLLEALLAGPESDGLRAPLPGGVEVRQVYLPSGQAAAELSPDGRSDSQVVVVDLASVDGADPPASGSRYEMLTVYSLVDTVLLNVEQVERLVLLWNGVQRVTFAGHLDTAHPLSANLDLLAPSGETES